MDLTDVFWTFHPKAEEYIFISRAHGTFSRIDLEICDLIWVTNQTSVNLRKLKSYQASFLIFSDHNTMRLDINYKKKTVKNTNTWRLNSTFPNNQLVTEKIKKEIKNFLETNDNENMTIQNLWD